MRTIPLIEPVVDDRELERVREVFDSGYLTQGPYAEALEDLLAERVGAEHAVATTSCTTGMELALDALGISSGDEVVVPNFTYPATASAVVRVGATPVLVDVDQETYNVDAEAVDAAVGADTAALLPVAWGGQPLDPDPLLDIAREYGLDIVEDAACAIGASHEEKATGSQFDASAFSFHPRKVLTTGEGGAVTTDDDDLERTMRQIKNFGTDPSGDHPGFVRADATNYRLSDVLAAIGVTQLERADEILGKRREMAALYDDLLSGVDGVTTPAVVDGGTHNYQCYCVYVEAGDDELRDELIEAMGEADIETQIGTHALSETDAFGDAKRGSELTTSERLATNLLTLPVAHSMTTGDQHRVVEELEAAINELA